MLPELAKGDALLLTAAAALSTHYIFKKYEPRDPLVHVGLLGAPPLLLSTFLKPYYGVLGAFAVTAALFFITLTTSIVLYRISPFHPLAQYPGPLLHKVSRLYLTWITMQGRAHLYTQQLHERYGDVVRVGPNEVTIRDASAILPVLGATGFPKSEAYMGRAMWAPVKSLIASSGDEHQAKRKPWNRAFNSTALKGYEGIISNRAEQLADLLSREKDNVDLGVRFSWFTFDFMSDMAFGGGSDMLTKGDEGSMWRVLDDGLAAGHFFANQPWIAAYATKFPVFGQDVKRMRRYGIERATARVQNGSLNKDLFHYLNNEDGTETQTRPLAQVISDGALAVIAGSDTTANVLTNLFFFLLSEPAEYKRLQAEVDSFFPPGENALDTRFHQEMPILNAAINEALRLVPVVPSGSQRTAPPGGKLVGPHYLPEGTNASVHFYSVHRDSRNFAPHTTSFWPDRFRIAAGEITPADAGIDERNFVHNAAAFVPFSFGPANCVGKNLALQEMRMTVCLLMQRLEMRFAPGFDPESYEQGLRDYFVVKKPELRVDVSLRDQSA
ncbi:hypothetical protein CERSUDRAFT_111756 [Gelatoporia subvermispora B]|uniref:High nitrogen upregulated cytochrome P450 monooxygenase 2 n=1 Tax=Ceriporiopsis subvermispora (strain B) TaxID=914234 RepID=M2R4I1_CERS8|nr:hypothetical protein CERSUDRAFT_111756 [Gelatoporia subvermispora B]